MVFLYIASVMRKIDYGTNTKLRTFRQLMPIKAYMSKTH